MNERCIGNALDNCPCANCLVKIVCEEDCENLSSYFRKAEKAWRSSLKEGSYYPLPISGRERRR